MRIHRIHVNGFGRFADIGLGPFERPVTVFLGPNEAGKSTLLEFIRRVFFGFPDGRSTSNPYRPLAGGRHGGSLDVVSHAGETVTVQRFQGMGGGPVTLTAASGGLLPQGELSRLLGHHSRDVFQNVFTFTLDELYSEALLKDDSVNVQIYSVGMGAAKLPAALKALVSEKQTLFLKGGSRHKIAEAGDELRKIEATLKQVKGNAAKYGDLMAYLKQVEEEFERLSGLRRKHQSQLDHQKQLESAWDDWNGLNQAEEQLAELPVISDFPVDGVSRLEKLEERITTAQKEYDSADEEVKEAKAKAEAQVEHEAILNHSTDIRNLEQGRTSFDNSVRDLPKRKGDLIGLQRKLTGTLNDLGTDWDETRLDAVDLSIAVREEISQYRERLREAVEAFNRSKIKRDQAEEDLEKNVETENRAKQELKAVAKPVGRKNIAKVLAALGASAGIVLLVVGAILGGYALPVGVIAGILLVCIAAYLFVVDQPSTVTNAEYASLSRDLAKAIESTKRGKNRLEQSKEDVKKASTQLEDVQGEWRQWLAERDLREEFSPDNIEVLRGLVDLGRTHHDGVEEMKRRIDTIQKDIDEYVAIAAPLASDFDVPFDRNESSTVAAAADSLVKMHTNVELRVRDRTDAEDNLKKAERQLKERASDLRKAEEEMKVLLQSGDAADAEDFRKRGETYHQRMDLEEKQRDILGRLQRLSGPGEPLAALKKQLGATDIQAIRDAERRAEEDHDAVDKKINSSSTERGEIQSDLKRLTGEEASSRLRAERQRLREEIRGHAREWVIHIIAENLLKDAQGKFEKERQPGVVRHAESFFKNITDGRYQTVFSPLGSSEIHVTDSSGVSKQPNQLSRGTREQLFLSLRFGLVRELGQRSERLPVIVDEALVNFDPERGLRAARAFVELSQTNQVLVFTCQPTIVELFQSAAAKSGVQEPEVILIG